MKKLFHLAWGGLSKVNIATDLELAVLKTLGRQKYLTDPELKALTVDEISKAQAAMANAVREKSKNSWTAPIAPLIL